MKTITTNIYTIDEHPNPENVFEWIRNNWHDLNQHSLDDFIESLKALEKEVGGELDYRIGTVPDRGEYLSLKGHNKERLNSLNKEDLPLTGVCWDYNVIEALQNGHIEEALHDLHEDTEYIYSDEGLTELCQANEYHFAENGKFYPV